MNKNLWSDKDMSSVDVATAQVNELVAREMGPGRTVESAMRRVEATFGIGYWTQFGLLYKRPKNIAADLSERIRQAWAYKLECSVRRDLAALETDATRARMAGAGDDDLESLERKAREVLEQIRKARDVA